MNIKVSLVQMDPNEIKLHQFYWKKSYFLCIVNTFTSVTAIIQTKHSKEGTLPIVNY